MMDVIIMYLFLFGSIILTYFAIKYSNKITHLAKQRPEEAQRYGSTIVAGIVSGVIVLVLDRTITLLSQAKFSFATPSIWDFVFSVTGVLIILFFNAVLLLFLVFYIIHKGMRKD